MVDLVMSQIITPLPHQCTDTVTMIVVVLFVASLELVVSVNKFVMSRYVMSCVVCGAHPWKSDSAPLNVASLVLLSSLFVDHSLSCPPLELVLRHLLPTRICAFGICHRSEGAPAFGRSAQTCFGGRCECSDWLVVVAVGLELSKFWVLHCRSQMIGWVEVGRV